MVALENVSRRFPMDHQFVSALDGISLSLDAGEFVAAAGPSGSGKSTLLNLIGCIDQPTSGSIRIDEVETRRLSPAQLSEFRRRQIGFVFQTFTPLPGFPAFEDRA